MTHISMSRALLPPDATGLTTLINLVKGALEKGLFSFNIGIYDVIKLREAQADPGGHRDLIVRVWGYSACFIDLSPEMQEHIIARVARQSGSGA